MVEKVYFQSSMPRSGSTLLQNIMGQNPDFYVSPTSGLLELVYSARAQFTHSPEFRAQDKVQMERAFSSFCREGMFAYYNSLTDKPYALDKSRGWGIHYGFLNSFYPQPKIICMVRNLKGIFASMEKNFRKSQQYDSGLVNHAEMTGTTVPKRVVSWANSQPVGLALERFSDIFRQELAQNMLFVRYEDLCFEPERQMARIYDYLELPRFEHDFENIQQITIEDDEVYGIFGDHKVRPNLTATKADWQVVLGADVCEWIDQNYSWYQKIFSYS